MMSLLKLQHAAFQPWSHPASAPRLRIPAPPQGRALRRAAQEQAALQDRQHWVTAEWWTRRVMWTIATLIVLVDLLATFGPRLGL
jgi:hypothetical protein